MASYTVRGMSHNIVYYYNLETGEKKQQWESYKNEREAEQRKGYIDYLEKFKMAETLRKTALEYQKHKATEKAVKIPQKTDKKQTCQSTKKDKVNNLDKTYGEFTLKWLPYQAKIKNFSPNTYDSYNRNLRLHILPYFGSIVMSTITSEDIDDFLDYLSRKPCEGSKSYGKKSEDIPTLGSSTLKKCFTILTGGFTMAKKLKYVSEIPELTSPTEISESRKAWDSQRFIKVLSNIEDNLLHLAVHLAFVGSLRAGEAAGIEISSFDQEDMSLWIAYQTQRVPDDALEILKKEVFLYIPKRKKGATAV